MRNVRPFFCIVVLHRIHRVADSQKSGCESWLGYLGLDFYCLTPCLFAVPEQKGKSVEDNNQDKQHAIAQEHTQEFHTTANHDTDKVRGEGDIRCLTVPEG